MTVRHNRNALSYPGYPVPEKHANLAYHCIVRMREGGA